MTAQRLTRLFNYIAACGSSSSTETCGNGVALLRCTQSATLHNPGLGQRLSSSLSGDTADVSLDRGSFAASLPRRGWHTKLLSLRSPASLDLLLVEQGRPIPLLLASRTTPPSLLFLLLSSSAVFSLMQHSLRLARSLPVEPCYVTLLTKEAVRPRERKEQVVCSWCCDRGERDESESVRLGLHRAAPSTA